MNYFFNDEEVTFENTYEVLCFNAEGRCIYEYEIEADNTLGAATAAEEFFAADCPNEKLSLVRVIIGVTFDEYVID